MHTRFDDDNRLMAAARRHAHELRRQAVRESGAGLGRWLRQASAAAGTRAPRSSSTSSAGSSGTASPRQATC